MVEEYGVSAIRVYPRSASGLGFYHFRSTHRYPTLSKNSP
jgi:hypothetical protein